MEYKNMNSPLLEQVRNSVKDINTIAQNEIKECLILLNNSIHPVFFIVTTPNLLL